MFNKAGSTPATLLQKHHSQVTVKDIEQRCRTAKIQNNKQNSFFKSIKFWRANSRTRFKVLYSYMISSPLISSSFFSWQQHFLVLFQFSTIVKLDKSFTLSVDKISLTQSKAECLYASSGSGIGLPEYERIHWFLSFSMRQYCKKRTYI